MLETAWDPHSPTETVFKRANDCRAFARSGGDQLTDSKLIRETLKVFEKSGVLGDGVKDWKKKTAANKTWANMRTHFRDANRRRLLDSRTSNEAGCAANATETLSLLSPSDLQEIVREVIQQEHANAAVQPPPSTTTGTQSAAPNGWHYCWTHGLGRNPNHTSQSCTNPAEGHQNNATLDNMRGGSNQIVRCRGDRNRRPRSGQS